MKKNYKQKIRDFLVKEGFYIILIVCVCIIGGIFALSYKESKSQITEEEKIDNSNENEQKNNESKDEISMNKEEQNKNNYQDAEIVNNEKKNQKANNSDETEQTNASTKLDFQKPIEGKLLRGYTYPKPVYFDENHQRTIRGIDIEAKIGSEIKASEDGIIEKIENTGVEDGMTIVIKHPNNIKTQYSNLSEKVNVKLNQTVKKGTVIGYVGDTAKIFNKEKFGEHLNFQVLDSNNEQVNPLKYFNYK